MEILPGIDAGIEEGWGSLTRCTRKSSPIISLAALHLGLPFTS
jgi:hypothetical protein